MTAQLATLEVAVSPLDMNLPGWQLHALKGDLEGYWSVSVNGNWCLTFKFNDDGNAEVVDYQDYH